MKGSILFGLLLTFCLVTVGLYGQTFTRIKAGVVVNDGGDSYSGSWGDYDNDGDLDLFVTDVGTNPNRLYANNGDGTFTKITSGPIVNDIAASTSSCWGDYDNDGYLDLFVANQNDQNNFLYHNNGDGSFAKITIGSIVNDGGKSYGCSWGDFDNDGYLDLFVANDGNNFLYHNRGNGTFNKISIGAIVNDGGNSWGCSWGDYDNDGYLDLFVANRDGQNNFLYRNRGNGTFDRITTGAIANDGGDSFSGSWGDYDNDGDLDLFVANRNQNNFLYRNDGKGSFTKITTGDIVNNIGNARSSSWCDYDNDGDLDLLVVNQSEDNFLYSNNGDGTFTRIIPGIIVTDGTESNMGCSWADYDNDGDLDLFIANGVNNENNSLYANNGNTNHWINIKCIGTKSNTSGIGAKVKVKVPIAGNAIWQMQEISGQTGWCSQNSLNAEFGLGNATTIDSIKIEWPGGTVQVLTNQTVDKFLKITEASSNMIPTVTTKPATDITATTAILHGTVNPEGLSTTVKFEYGTTLAYGSEIMALENPVMGDTTMPVSAQLGALSPNTTYHYRLVAINSTGTSYGDDQMFTTLSDIAPIIMTDPATNITATTATLHGTVNPNGLSMTVKFQYGLTTTYGSEVTATPGSVAGTAVVSVSAPLTGLSPNTTYHYRLMVTDIAGAQPTTQYAGDQMFTTASGGGSTIITEPATDITTTSAILHGTVNPEGLSTSVKFQYGTTPTYGSEIMAVESPLTGFEPIAVSAQLTGLSPDTTYYYRVVAINSNGTRYGGEQMFTTSGGNVPMLLTEPATDITATTATLHGTVNPNGLSLAVKFQYGLTTTYGSEVTATPGSVTGTAVVSVSASLPGLSPNTTYHYRVVATDLAGALPTIQYGGDQMFTTLGNAPTIFIEQATDITPTSATLRGTVNPHGLSTTVKFHYGLTQTYGNEIVAVESPVTGIESVSVHAYLNGLSPNTTYHYRLIASNSTGTYYSDDQMFVTAYPSTWDLSTMVNFPSHSNGSEYQATDYRIVGLPGASNLLVDALLSGTPGEDWQVYWDNGAAENYLVKFFNGNSVFKFSVGRAFWLIKKGPWSVTQNVPTAPLNASQEVEIPLHPGWNLITNPFPFSIPWLNIQAVNGITNPIWSFNGSFTQVLSDFEPYIGYYFFNQANLPVLRIPSWRSAWSKPTILEPTVWKVNITLASGAFIDQTTSFGVSTGASTGLDRFDFRKPRAIAAIPTVSFHRPEWDAQYSSFATDIRPEFEEAETWDFEVYSTQREPSQLAFSGLADIPPQFEVYLIDKGRARQVNLRETSVYRFTPATDISRFCVLVGKADAVEERLSSVLPTEFALGHNYPNPFNALTTIPVDIPIPAEVGLKVYNLLGEEVKTIYAGTLEAGRYWFSYDGTDKSGKTLGSGVYLYRLITNKKVTLTGKMILMK